ncbi:MAG: bifunctional diguanylate cyclase/phosphodiesterase [Patulibacter sp.]|nr:bifunctional diguanylate cyclase/phosphodiesterase [Patulibacter sp.]
METLPPASAHGQSRIARFGALGLVLLIMGLTVGAAERARGLADERRQAQVELRRAQAASEQLRAIAAETAVLGNIDAPHANEAFQAGAALAQSVDRLQHLGVHGPANDRLRKAMKDLVVQGTAAAMLGREGKVKAAQNAYHDNVDPLLSGVIRDTDEQMKVEDRRAHHATVVARDVLIGGTLLGLLALALLVRRFEAIARQGRAETLLRRQAFTDALTGLPNRAALEIALGERLSVSTSLADETGSISLAEPDLPPVAMALLDIDDLKTINDSLGHGRGDELVRTIGARIAATLGPHDLVTRFGGDEFGVLLADPSPERAIREIERVLQAIHRPVLLGDRDVRVTASAGVAVGLDVETIVRDADIAMYAAKAAGKDRVSVFSQSMRDDALANLELTADLRRALTRDELFLEYQPIVDLKHGRVDGVEALVRWMHPVRGRMNPVEFIGLAERTGLIGPLGWWVMQTSCGQMRRWLDEGWADPTQHVSVNVSPIQLAEPDMARRIARILRETGLDPRQLQLEITESVLVDRPEALVADLTELMGLGVRIAIDDFGTGHSVLAYLKDLPVDVLKIDKAFVDEIESDAGRARLTQGIVQLAQALDLSIVAEGIETAPQASLLHGLGDMLGQGFLYSRPVAPSVAGQLLRDGNYGPTPESADFTPDFPRPSAA